MSDEHQLRREIQREREELAGAVDSLRTELGRAKRRAPVVAAGGLAVATAVKVGLRRLRRR